MYPDNIMKEWFAALESDLTKDLDKEVEKAGGTPMEKRVPSSTNKGSAPKKDDMSKTDDIFGLKDGSTDDGKPNKPVEDDSSDTDNTPEPNIAKKNDTDNGSGGLMADLHSEVKSETAAHAKATGITPDANPNDDTFGDGGGNTGEDDNTDSGETPPPEDDSGAPDTPDFENTEDGEMGDEMGDESNENNDEDDNNDDEEGSGDPNLDSDEDKPKAEFIDKNKVKDQLIYLYNTINGNIEVLSSSINSIGEEEHITVSTSIINHLRNSKDFIYKTVTKDLKNLDYVELLKRYITIKRVYNLCVEMMERYHATKSKAPKK